MEKLPIRKAVGMIIKCAIPAEHILLIRKVRREDISNSDIPPEWDLPKGGMKKGESEQQTLWREVEEELGTRNFNLIRRLPVSINFKFPKGVSTKYSGQKTALYLLEYLGDVNSLKPKSSEIGEIQPVHLNDLEKYIKFKETLEALNKIKQKQIK